MLLSQWPPTTKFLMFTGKGGVGKTTVSCATALSLAAQGRKVLLVSTDPASNVAQVFGQPIGSEITALGYVVARDTGMEVELDAIEIDPNMEAEKYRESILAPVRHLLPPEVLRESEETLSGSCTVEVASFNRFVDFLDSPNIVDAYDHIVFDTAPTGHTLRLLALPGDWSSFIEKGTGDASCLGPLSGLDKHRQTYDDAVNTLKDPALTTLVLVARAQDSTLQEAERAASELSELGVNPQALVVNALLPEAGNDPLHRRLMLGERSVLNGLATTHPVLSGLACFTIPMNPEPVMGIKGLTTVAPQSHESVAGLEELPSAEVVDVNEAVQSALSQATEKIVGGGPKVVLAMGKGGVGKTTVAQALAISVARKGLPVLLATTDPASHLDVTLPQKYPGLDVVSIDPHKVVEEYRREVLNTKGATLDSDGRAQLVEDLASPCTEEVAVFRAFSAVLEEADHRWVIIDTAPTGHTLLLLDATGSYHRELLRQSGADEGSNGTLTALMRLRDQSRTFPILVTLPESTPILEAKELADDLARAGITPRAWVINQYLPMNQSQSTFLKQRATAQRNTVERYLATDQMRTPVWEIPVV